VTLDKAAIICCSEEEGAKSLSGRGKMLKRSCEKRVRKAQKCLAYIMLSFHECGSRAGKL